MAANQFMSNHLGKMDMWQTSLVNTMREKKNNLGGGEKETKIN